MSRCPQQPSWWVGTRGKKEVSLDPESDAGSPKVYMIDCECAIYTHMFYVGCAGHLILITHDVANDQEAFQTT